MCDEEAFLSNRRVGKIHWAASFVELDLEGYLKLPGDCCTLELLGVSNPQFIAIRAGSSRHESKPRTLKFKVIPRCGREQCQSTSSDEFGAASALR
jgi:hypothetical protein